MKLWQYAIALLLGLSCLGLAIALVLAGKDARRLQAELQAQQGQIQSGVLGPQGQQVVGSVLQDLANASITNVALRQLLARHGYSVQAPAETAATNARVAIPNLTNAPGGVP